MKNILFTTLSDAILSRMAAHLLMRTEHNVYCLLPDDERAVSTRQHDERLRFVSADITEGGLPGELTIDEVWHAAGAENRADHLQTVRALLRFMERERISIINYVSDLFTPGQHEDPLGQLEHAGSNGNGNGNGRAVESEIISANERCGLGYRIFRPFMAVDLSGSMASDSASPFYRFISQLIDFKEEITDRSPDYFKQNGLTLAIRPDARVNLIDLDRAVEAVFKIASRQDTLNRCFDLVDDEPARLVDYCGPISGLLGVKVSCADSPRQLNPVDELLHLQTLGMTRYLGDAGGFSRPSELTSFAITPGDLSLKHRSQQVIESALSCHNAIKSEEATRIAAAAGSLEQVRISLQDDQHLSYYAGGSGPKTVVIINAFGQRIRHWERLISRLVEDHRVLVWGSRGNEPDAVGINQFNPLSTCVDDLEHILINERVEECDFVGWCTGPKIIVEYYRRHPERVSTMTFLGATFKNVERLRSFETAYERTLEPLFALVNDKPGLAGLLADSLKVVLLKQENPPTGSSSPAEGAREQFLQTLRPVNLSLQQFVMEPFSNQSSVINYARQLLDFWGHDVSPVLPQIKAPVLFVSGECDKIASPAIPKALNQIIPTAKYLEVKGGSHYLHYEKYALMAHLIEKFMKQTWDFHFDHGLVESH